MTNEIMHSKDLLPSPPNACTCTNNACLSFCLQGTHEKEKAENLKKQVVQGLFISEEDLFTKVTIPHLGLIPGQQYILFFQNMDA